MKLILVGGFLGAGKTSLLFRAAGLLAQRGHKAGLITNDQAPGLVDTALLAHTGAGVREVAGSCFCCNFDGLTQAIASLAAAGSDCVLAEPVGSCTDLSATILQPLKERFPEYHTAPLTVLIAPERVREVFQNSHPLLHPDAAYILRLQLEEADHILLSKTDTLTPHEMEEILGYLRAEFPATSIATIASHSGDGLAPWLDTVLSGAPAGTRIPEVDYDRYAHGEAVLGWLNATYELRWIGGLTPAWRDFLQAFATALHERLRHAETEIGHVKMLLECPDGRLTANLTGLRGDFQIQCSGALDRLSATLTLNARAQTAPATLQAALQAALATAAHARVAPRETALHALQPGRPTPTHRYAAVVR